MGSMVSRFMDGSARITASELQREWLSWTGDQREDFCQASAWLDHQSDFPDMLRFIMQNGGLEEWSAVAMSVGSKLPQEEAFATLTRALREIEIGRTANISQAIAITKHPEAKAALRQHLQAILEDEELWDDDVFINCIAFDLTTCIGHLIELGTSPADFEKYVRQLSQHVCARNRESCRGLLSKHYEWLTG
jgi:hypothetical protein